MGFTVWSGEAGRRAVRRGTVRSGKGFMVRRGGAEYCSVGHGVVRVSRFGRAKFGWVRSGWA